MKGTLDDNVTEGNPGGKQGGQGDHQLCVSADIISCVEFNQDGELLATGDKGGRVVIFQVIIKARVVSYVDGNYL